MYDYYGYSSDSSDSYDDIGAIALDCEMVGDVNNRNVLARVSIVDEDLNVLYDTFVHPLVRIGNYRTFKTGITAQDVSNGRGFYRVQNEVRSFLDRAYAIVGHSLHHDFAALQIDIDEYDDKIQQIQKFPLFVRIGRRLCGGSTPGLRTLTQHFLGYDIQQGPHCSIEDATASMKLFLKFMSN